MTTNNDTDDDDDNIFLLAQWTSSSYSLVFSTRSHFFDFPRLPESEDTNHQKSQRGAFARTRLESKGSRFSFGFGNLSDPNISKSISTISPGFSEYAPVDISLDTLGDFKGLMPMSNERWLGKCPKYLNKDSEAASMEGWDLHPVNNAGDSPTFRNMANEKASYPSDLYFFWLRGPHLSLKKLRKFLESFCSFSLSWQSEQSHCVFFHLSYFFRKSGYGWVPVSQTYDNDDWWHLTTESIDTDSLDKVMFGQPKLIAKWSLTKRSDTLRANNFTWHCFLSRRVT